MHIEFQHDVDAAHIPSEQQIEAWVSAAIQHIPEQVPIHQQLMVIRFVSREESAALNETFRHKTGPTNVLAFEDKPLAGLEPDTLGDLAICADVVAAEAAAQHKSVEAHWAHMVVHGFLHLMGYDHLDDAQAHRMEQQEIVILQALGFANPYAEH